MRRSPNIHERFLRHIWSKQYLKSNLETFEGKSLKVIEVGELNLDGGPDFKNAKIKIDNVTYIGDVEIHRTVFDWIKHQHQEDPRYNKVILHVVLKGNNQIPPIFVNSGRKIPLLILDRFLAESIYHIWQKAILDERLIKTEKIRCYAQNEYAPIEIIDKMLAKLSMERLELKLRRFEERLNELAYEKLMNVCEKLNQYGEFREEGNYDEVPIPIIKLKLTQKDLSSKEIWEQLLYEGIMEGLGYSKNREPFIKLAQNVTIKFIRTHKLYSNDVQLEAMLFGASGLMPKIDDLKDDESRQYVKFLSNEWCRLLSIVRFELLNTADWQFFPTRPLNFPTLRIAAACGIVRKIVSEDIFRTIIQILKSHIGEVEIIKALIKIFRIETKGFWKNHYHFGVKASSEHNVIGDTRIQQMIINTVLPLSLLYARIFKDVEVRDSVLCIYRRIRNSERNSIIKLMDKQLIKGRIDLSKASYQQALIHLYRYYCIENKCFDCELRNILK